jgi:hypothetical protein
MLVLVVAYGADAAADLAAALGQLREGTLDSPFAAAFGFGGVALAWWVWTLQRRLGRRDRLARTQATAVHAIAAAVWGLPLLILAAGLVTGAETVTGRGHVGATARDAVVVAANLFVVVALRLAKDCDCELAVPAPAAALTFDDAGSGVDAGAFGEGTVGLTSPPPAARNWRLAPGVVRAAALTFTALAAAHFAALVLSFRSCDGCSSGQILGTLTAMVLSPFVVVACAGALLVAIGVVRRWRSARSVGVLLAAVFAMTAPLVDQLLFGGIESALRGGRRAMWNGELAFLVSAVDVVVAIMLTRPAARGWELTRERVVRTADAPRVMLPADAPPPPPRHARSLDALAPGVRPARRRYGPRHRTAAPSQGDHHRRS